MVLHELAHAYHQRISDSLKTMISNAYDHAISSNLYSYVLYNRGDGVKTKTEWAYAVNDEKEYFAELTEAYFGINDYFPFDRKDLEKYDTAGYNMMVTVWGTIQP